MRRAILALCVMLLWSGSSRGDSFFFNAPSTSPVTSGLVAHFDASDTTTLNGGAIVPGGAVSSWASTIGSITATQGDVNRQPLWISSVPAINNMPVVRFDGINSSTSDRLGFTLPAGGLGNQATAFVVALNGPQSIGGSCCRTLFSENTGGANIGNNGYSLYVNRNDLTNQLAASRGTGGTAPAVSASPYVRDSAFHIWSFRSDNTTLTELHDNGALVASGALTGTGTTGTGYHIAGNLPDNSRSYAGDIAEILLFNRVLTDEEYDLVGFYLEQKYGINSLFTGPPPLAPEPGTLVLFAAMLLGLGVSMRRRLR